MQRTLNRSQDLFFPVHSSPFAETITFCIFHKIAVFQVDAQDSKEWGPVKTLKVVQHPKFNFCKFSPNLIWIKVKD